MNIEDTQYYLKIHTGLIRNNINDMLLQIIKMEKMIDELSNNKQTAIEELKKSFDIYKEDMLK